MIKEFVNNQKFESTADVMAAMKEMFADVLQQVMECELEEKLGYSKAVFYGWRPPQVILYRKPSETQNKCLR